MRVLALDTATARGSLALLENDRLLAEVRVTAPEGHSRWIFPAVDEVLAASGLGAADVDGWAVTLGPGSFTGVRVGVATVQGLAAGTGKACVGFSVLDVLAALGPEAAKVAVLDAWRGEVYAAVYGPDGSAVGTPFSGPLSALDGRVPARAVFLGDGLERYGAEVRERWPEATLAEVDLFLAAPLARLAQVRFRQGGGGGPEALAPLYLRGADIRLPG
jgi:tRNA threonylcarbamoyladenosine biosynthesis protein TsaB